MRSQLDLDFEFHLSDKFSSLEKEFRKEIRQTLRHNLLQKNELENQSWLQLKDVPQASAWAISITHCKQVGGFCLAKTGFGIGFDVEVTSRMNAKNLLQVSSQSELDKAPNSAALWVAKEAAFKAMYLRNQPVTVAPVIFDDWHVEQEVHIFSIADLIKGVVWDSQGLSFAVSICRKTLVSKL